MSNTIARLTLGLISLALTGLCPLLLQAQDITAPKSTSPSTVHATGCVQKGEEAGGFTMTGQDGKIWELHSSKMNLADHVGHKVTVTGHVEHKTKMQEAKMEKHETSEAGGKPYQDFAVTSMKMVSTSCP
jgi:hypothetical protein